MSGLTISLFKLFILLVTKGFPLLGEVLLKDRSLLEFLGQNKTLIIMLMLVVVLSVSLFSVRYKLEILTKDSKDTIVKTPTTPGPKKTPVEVVIEDIPPPIDSRTTIRKRLGEIE